MITHHPYPGDVSDVEWQFVVPYLCLLPEDAGQRVHNLWKTNSHRGCAPTKSIHSSVNRG
jgi:hypothetical protein